MEQKSHMLKKILPPLSFCLLFELIAVLLWQRTGNFFYLFNFSYIGLSVAAGILLFRLNYKHARRISQFLTGSYKIGRAHV